MKFPLQHATNPGSTDQRRSLNHLVFPCPIYRTLSNTQLLSGNGERSETAQPWKKTGELSVTEINQGRSSALCVHPAKLFGEEGREEQQKNPACLLGHLKELHSWKQKCCLYACPGVRPNLSVLAQERVYPMSGLLVSVSTPPSSVQACL